TGRPNARCPRPRPMPPGPPPTKIWPSPRTCGGHRPSTPTPSQREIKCPPSPIEQREVLYYVVATGRRQIPMKWTLDQIAWDRFDAAKVDPEILRNIKAAAMVE